LSLPATPAEFLKTAFDQMGMQHEYFGHTVPMTLGALNTHHIMPEKLAGLPVMEYPPKVPMMNYIIGHNIDFDRDMLDLKGAMPICTLALSRRYFPDLDSHSQGAVLYHIARITKRGEAWARDMLKDAHSADADVLNCARILKYIIYMIDRDNAVKGQLSWGDIYEVSQDARIPKVMAFGKFKGLEVQDVEPDWAKWYANCTNPLPDPFVLIALRRAGVLES
jgi:exodeoxyribonuclease X